jgi:hypothetical protein
MGIGRKWEKGEYNANTVYVNEKMIPVETILGMGLGNNKGE